MVGKPPSLDAGSSSSGPCAHGRLGPCRQPAARAFRAPLSDPLADEDGSDSPEAIKRKIKYPLAACEVLSCALDGVLSTLASSADLMGLLWGFLDQEPPLDPTQAGYFGRAAAALLGAKGGLALEYVRLHPAVLDGLLRHIESNSIADLIVQIAGGDDAVVFPTVDFRKWLAHDSGLLESLLALLQAEGPPAACANAVDVLSQIALAQPSPLATRLAQPDCLEVLVSQGTASPHSLMPSVVRVLLALFDPHPPEVYGLLPGPTRRGDGQGDEGCPEVTAATADYLSPRLGTLAELLDAEASSAGMGQPWGLLAEPVGLYRIRVASLFAALVQRGTDDVRRAVAESRAIPRLFRLFERAPVNNLLHNEVLSLVRAGLEQGDAAFLAHLVEECRLLEWLPALSERWDPPQPEGRASRFSFRVGYMGHVAQMATAVAVRCGTSDYLRDACQASSAWGIFMDGRMEEQRHREDVHAWRCGRPGPDSPPDTEPAQLTGEGKLPDLAGRYGADDDSSSDEDEDGGPSATFRSAQYAFDDQFISRWARGTRRVLCYLACAGHVRMRRTCGADCGVAGTLLRRSGGQDTFTAMWPSDVTEARGDKDEVKLMDEEEEGDKSRDGVELRELSQTHRWGPGGVGSGATGAGDVASSSAGQGMDVDVERSGVAARVRSPGGQRAEGGDIWQQLVDEADEAAGPGTGGSGQAGG